MGFFRKKNDPISERARALNAEIAELEEKIRKLDSQLKQNPQKPAPHRTDLPNGISTHAPEPRHAVHEPIFEEVDRNRLTQRADTAAAPEYYNELGVRKYDLPALLRRIGNHFHGPSTTNPKLVNYLAAGGIQGLRPLRYEKRVARNRFIFFVTILTLVLLGMLLWSVRHRY
ncbi:MAG TPA: hypothetical protein GYA07_13505 [Verrucomicrobia bacterium]|nr:hypothetical protein [Verrucomicrobiota bacterium]HOB32217.1 hypothetical protein [Verrucomicrobiota bacterium]HOP97672.1 hypothetical protein [Verrucomicrobiota bacterium]